MVLRSSGHSRTRVTGLHVHRKIFVNHRSPNVLCDECVRRPVIPMTDRVIQKSKDIDAVWLPGDGSKPFHATPKQLPDPHNKVLGRSSRGQPDFRVFLREGLSHQVSSNLH